MKLVKFLQFFSIHFCTFVLDVLLFVSISLRLYTIHDYHLSAIHLFAHDLHFVALL